MRQDIQEKERQNRFYRGCIEKQCTYFIEKTPGHGEEASWG